MDRQAAALDQLELPRQIHSGDVPRALLEWDRSKLFGNETR
jgi:hypothetical protein